MRRFRPSLGQALLLSFVTMTLLTVSLVGLTHAHLRRVLEVEVGARLAHTARLLASGFDGALLSQFREGDESLPAYRLLQARLARQAGLAGVERASVVSPRLLTLLDSRPDRPPGSYRHELLASRDELAAAGRGEATVSPLHAGDDGALRLTAFAPVRDGAGTVRALMAIEARSDLFSPLAELRRRMWALGLAGLTVAALTGLALLRQVQGRLQRLRETVGRARRGDLTAAVEVVGGDEIGALGRELDGMIARLAGLQEYLENVLGGLGAGLLVVDAEGRLSLANSRALEMLGLQRSDLGRPLAELLAHEPDLLALAASGPPREGGARSEEICLGGSLAEGGRVVAAGASRLAGREGSLTLSLLDITGVKLAERRARANERLAMLGSMAGGLLHEVRNPLASMMVYLDLLRSEERTSEGAEMLDRTLSQAERLAAFLEDFQVFAGLKPLRTAELDPREVAGRAGDAVSWPGSVTFRGVSGPETRVLADVRLLEHAVRNLLANAREALAEQGGTVGVSVEREGDEAVIAVSDDGPGIPGERRDLVFDPLFTTKKEGSGLGLTIVERVAQAHGGSVRFRRLEGVTRFEIRLPAAGKGDWPWPAS